MYTIENYKDEINKIINLNGYDPIIVAKKTYKIYFNHIREIDKNTRDILLDIATMEDGPEFEMTETEFNQFLQKI